MFYFILSNCKCFFFFFILLLNPNHTTMNIDNIFRRCYLMRKTVIILELTICCWSLANNNAYNVELGGLADGVWGSRILFKTHIIPALNVTCCLEN